jgi:hypothetical protein
MWKYIFLGMLLLPMSAYSLTVPMNVQLRQEKSSLESLPIVNTDSMQHDYRISVREVSFPDKNMQVVNDQDKDIWLSEPAFSLSAGSKKVLNIAYHGEPSQRERYFQLEINELLVDKTNSNQITGRMMVLVMLAPLDMTLKYEILEGRLHNQGNASFLFMEDFDCGRTAGLTTIVPPGKTIVLPQLKEKTVHSIGNDGVIKVINANCDIGEH